jgi:folate-dependent phosphoribosylglycinamide formyltransferase PurN
MSDKKKIIVFASGTKEGGGSGFENLVNAAKNGILDAEIIAVVSNHENGGVRERADRLGIPFIYFPARKIPDSGEFLDKEGNKVDPSEFATAENYRKIVGGTDLVCLSGWLKLVTGLDPKKTINIHPGPLPRFGGPGMYGHHVHEAVMEAYGSTSSPQASSGQAPVTHSAVTMHFVTEKYDEGPVFFTQSVPILPDDTAETLAKRVNEAEHKWQPIITQKVLSGEISWDGQDPASLKGAILN